jgi:hypothetical protein
MTSALSRYISSGKVPAPKMVTAGGMTMHLWTNEDVEKVRKLLPNIPDGRKTRYKKHSAVSTQQSAKTKGKTNKKSKP